MFWSFSSKPQNTLGHGILSGRRFISKHLNEYLSVLDYMVRVCTACEQTLYRAKVPISTTFVCLSQASTKMPVISAFGVSSPSIARPASCLEAVWSAAQHRVLSAVCHDDSLKGRLFITFPRTTDTIISRGCTWRFCGSLGIIQSVALSIPE